MQPEKSTGRKKCAMVKNNGSGIQTDLSLTLLLLFHSCETIGKVLNFSEFLHEISWDLFLSTSANLNEFPICG